MIIIRLKGGLGNQMFQYALGRSLSLEHGLAFKVDSSYLHSMNQSDRLLRLRNFNLDLEECGKDEIAVYAGAFQKILDCFLPFSKKKKILEGSPRFDERVLHKKDGYFDGHWNTERYFQKFESAIVEDFRLKEPFGEAARIFFEKMQSEPNATSIHVRRGDYAAIKKIAERHGTLPISYYEQAMEGIAHKFPQAHFFIFSDDIAWAKEHMPKKYSLTFVSNPAIEDYEELMLMAMCKHNIIANSTFSWWAAWLNRNAEKVIIAPRRWFLDVTIDTRDLIPSSWQQI